MTVLKRSRFVLNIEIEHSKGRAKLGNIVIQHKMSHEMFGGLQTFCDKFLVEFVVRHGGQTRKHL